MNVSVTLALDIFSLLVLLVILAVTFGRLGAKKDRVYDLTMIVILMLLTDVLYTAYYGRSEDQARTVLFISKTMYLMLNTLLIMRWIALVGQSVCGRNYSNTIFKSLFRSIFFLNIAFCLVNVFIPVIFRIDRAGNFRVVLWGMWLFTALNYINAGVSLTFLLVNRKKLRKSAFLNALLFAVPPIVGELFSLFDNHSIEIVCAYSLSAVLLIHLSDIDNSYFDRLTGLGNWRFVNEKLDKWFAAPDERTICGLMLEINNLSDINKNLGYDAGDEVLLKVANLLDGIDSERRITSVRYGSNRFGNVWIDKNGTGTEPVRHKIEAAVNELNRDLPADEKIHFSIGTYSCSNRQMNKDGFMLVADSREYRQYREIDIVIERALDEHLFSVYYQPIWSEEEGRFICAEALLRLEDDSVGHYPPSAIIPAAERTGMISRIGDYVLDEVCRFISSPEFQETGLEFIEVNLSIVQCMQDNLKSEVMEILERYGVSPHRINVEITESAISSNSRKVQNNMNELSEAGIAISLDDFGSGYSNLRRLSLIPFSIIKLDKSVADQLFDKKMQTILSGMVSLFKEMDMKIVAEGIETAKQMKVMLGLGVDYIQGFIFSKALPQNELLAYIKDRNSAALKDKSV